MAIQVLPLEVVIRVHSALGSGDAVMHVELLAVGEGFTAGPTDVPLMVRHRDLTLGVEFLWPTPLPSTGAGSREPGSGPLPDQLAITAS